MTLRQWNESSSMSEKIHRMSWPSGVTIRWTMRGTSTGPLLGRPPSGQPVELAAIVIFRLAGGKIAERWAGWKPGYAPGP